VGSSSSKASGCSNKALISDTRCFCPTDNSPAGFIEGNLTQTAQLEQLSHPLFGEKPTIGNPEAERAAEIGFEAVVREYRLLFDQHHLSAVRGIAAAPSVRAKGGCRRLTVEEYRSGRDVNKTSDRSQEGGLTDAGGTGHRREFAAVQGETDAAE